MAENSFDFYKYNTGDTEKGAQKAHSSFSTNVLSSGGTYCRDFYVNSNLVKLLLTGSNFTSLDGTQAISMRAVVRTTKVIHNQVFFIAKTNAANPTTIASYGTTPGYKFGLRSPSTAGTLFGYFQAYNGSTHYNNASTGNSVTGMTGTNTYHDKWTHLRMDVCPVVTGESITGDKIKLYVSTDAGSSWTLKQEITIDSDENGFIPWSDATYNRYGLMLYNAYIDNFEVYLSTGYA